jgi:hypothetical protein
VTFVLVEIQRQNLCIKFSVVEKQSLSLKNYGAKMQNFKKNWPSESFVVPSAGGLIAVDLTAAIHGKICFTGILEISLNDVNEGRETLLYREVSSSNWFLTIHINSEQLLAQLNKLLFKHVGKLFEEPVGRNISQCGKNSLVNGSSSNLQPKQFMNEKCDAENKSPFSFSFI